MRSTAAIRRSRLAQPFLSQAAMPGGALAITGMEAIRVRAPGSGRSWNVLRVDTRSGRKGYGEARSFTPTEFQKAKELLIGQPANRYEYARGLLAGMPALRGAVETALLDIVGQEAKAPVFQVLGGPTRNKARMMAALSGADESALLAELRAGLNAGYRVFSIPLPARSFPNPRPQFIQRVVERLTRLRTEAGEEVDFVLDCAGELVTAEAANISAALEKFHPLWLDDPVDLSNLGAVRKLARENVTPLGFGRHVTGPGVFQDLLREQTIDVLRPDLTLHGPAGVRKLAALAENYYTAVAPSHQCGPIATLAGLQVAASLPNFFLQDAPAPKDPKDAAMYREVLGGFVLEIKDGFASLPAGPGLGAAVSEQALSKYKEVA